MVIFVFLLPELSYNSKKAFSIFFPDGSFKFNARRKLLKDGETIDNETK